MKVRKTYWLDGVKTNLNNCRKDKHEGDEYEVVQSCWVCHLEKRANDSLINGYNKIMTIIDIRMDIDWHSYISHSMLNTWGRSVRASNPKNVMVRTVVTPEIFNRYNVKTSTYDLLISSKININLKSTRGTYTYPMKSYQMLLLYSAKMKPKKWQQGERKGRILEWRNFPCDVVDENLQLTLNVVLWKRKGCIILSS